MIATSFAMVGALAAALVPAPQAASQTAAQTGVAPPWEARNIIEQLRTPLNSLRGAAQTLQVRSWQGTGASNYVSVADSAQRQLAAISAALDQVERQPEKLSRVIRIYIALQQLEPALDSLAAGAERFESPQAARALRDATNALLNQRGKLVGYLLDLAEFTENNTAISLRELESCQKQLWQRASQPQRARPRR